MNDQNNFDGLTVAPQHIPADRVAEHIAGNLRKIFGKAVDPRGQLITVGLPSGADIYIRVYDLTSPRTGGQPQTEVTAVMPGTASKWRKRQRVTNNGNLNRFSTTVALAVCRMAMG